MHFPHSDDWPRLIEAQHASGLSVSEFCAQQNIRARDFYLQHYRLHQFSTVHQQAQPSAFVRVEKSQKKVTQDNAG